MRTVDRIAVSAPLAHVFRVASAVQRWPAFLTHYRWVRILHESPVGALVEMAAWRPFGRFRYPAWWVSEMEVLPERREIRFRHVRGITRGMNVVWRLEERESAVEVTIVHEWPGPPWPLLGKVAANWVIGPVFVHGIASLTLAGLKREAERG